MSGESVIQWGGDSITGAELMESIRRAHAMPTWILVFFDDGEAAYVREAAWREWQWPTPQNQAAWNEVSS